MALGFASLFHSALQLQDKSNWIEPYNSRQRQEFDEVYTAFAGFDFSDNGLLPMPSLSQISLCHPHGFPCANQLFNHQLVMLTVNALHWDARRCCLRTGVGRLDFNSNFELILVVMSAVQP